MLAKRDPRKTARNKRIKAMSEQLRLWLDEVIEDTGLRDENELNATIGHKTGLVIDLKHEVINSPDHYVALWMEGFSEHLEQGKPGGFETFYAIARKSSIFRQYLTLFLQRSYLKHYEELCKRRPSVEQAEVWMGQNKSDYGLLVTPRFKQGAWENDKSEIRHFKPRYWTIGHVLTSGIVVPSSLEIKEFTSVDDYLWFFEHVLVRDAGSSYQNAIASMYSAFVRSSADPLSVPLLLPELRYSGRAAKHEHRLDFCIIDPDTLDKVGFELSPWSSHGQLATKGRTGVAINAEAQENFEKEMKKLKKYFKKHGIYALVYTDTDLANIAGVFTDIAERLDAVGPTKQLSFAQMDDFFL